VHTGLINSRGVWRAAELPAACTERLYVMELKTLLSAVNKMQFGVEVCLITI
jgi:hypothetical protein